MTAVNQAPTAATPTITHDRLPMLKGLTMFAIAAVAFGLYMALFYAGQDALQGNIQRIFYIHLPTFFGATLAFVCAAVGGALYLWTRNVRWDKLALAGVEVGLSLSLVTLVTGMFWARPIWNTWWTWDPRLTSTAIMALTYAAYLMLRNGLENPEHRRRFASVYSILALSTVIFVIVITRIRPDTIHPAVIGASSQNAQGGFAMTDSMITALMSNFVIWVFIVTPVLIWWRIRLESLTERVRHARVTALGD